MSAKHHRQVQEGNQEMGESHQLRSEEGRGGAEEGSIRYFQPSSSKHHLEPFLILASKVTLSLLVIPFKPKIIW